MPRRGSIAASLEPQSAGLTEGTDVSHAGWGPQWSSAVLPEESQDDVDARRALGHRRRRRRQLRIGLRGSLLVVALLLAVVAAVVVWVGVDALNARGELKTAATQVHVLQGQVEKGDRKGAKVTLTSLQGHAAAAQAGTHGPQWSVVRALPWVGPNVRAVQTVSEVIDGLAVNALPTLMDATSLVDPTTLAPVNGRVDLKPLVKAEPKVVAADTEVQTAARRLDAIDSKPLLAGVATSLVDLRAQVAKVALTTATAARAVRLLPPMLGADGPREYLLLVQNNAEQRATGGIPGSVLLLRAVDGAVKVVEQRAGNTLGNLSKPVLPLTAGEQGLFGQDLGRTMLDVTFTPDFPRSGQLARAIWQRKVGGDVDGVLSIDPGALADMLGATGPVDLPSGQQLTQANAVQLLLNTVYLQIADPKAQDAFFAATSGSVFNAILGGQGKPAKVVDALAQAAREGRLMVWSAHKNEQALLSGTVLSGGLVGVQGDSPVVGVYLNDGSAAKIGYYLRTDVVATSTGCRWDGSKTLSVRVTLTNTAAADAANLPPYLTGGGNVIPAGQVRTNLLLYAPFGGRVDDVRVSGGEPGVFSQTHNGLAVVGKTVQLKPGQRTVIDYNLLTGKAQPGTPVLRVTPVALGKNVIGAPIGCS
jgi:hypothetical protein